jgi:hypothetical protein
VNVNLLIDAIVRQTMVLIAQLATTAGARAPLAHTANRVFVDLVRELKQQGLGSKIISDMFGLTLRAYHAKVARLSESGTERGRSLWEALLAFVQERGPVSRLDILQRFSGDEETVVRGVLRDLVDSGFLFRSGRGDWTTFHVTTEEDRRSGDDEGEHLAHLVWIVVYRNGPLTRAQIAERVVLDERDLDVALASLVTDGRITLRQSGQTTTYSTDGCVVPLGSPAGWEAAVFDHYQALVTALCAKLRLGRTRAVPGEWMGGSTYSVTVWSGHPMREEALGLLQRTRDHASDLRARIEAYNATHPVPVDGDERVIFYVGQAILGLEEGDE